LEFLWEEEGWLVWHGVARPAGEGAARGGLREAGCECGSLFCAFSGSPPLRTNPGHIVWNGEQLSNHANGACKWRMQMAHANGACKWRMQMAHADGACGGMRGVPKGHAERARKPGRDSKAG